MKKGFLPTLSFSIVLGCFISGWLQSSQAQSDEHVVTDLQGQVSVKRARRTKFVPAYIGMFVGDDDIFRMDKPGSKASISCADGTPRLVDRTPFTLRCPKPAPNVKPVLPEMYRGWITGIVRGGPKVDVFPILVSPRMTRLLNPTPVIRWLPARDATSYKVSVLDGRTEVWSTSVNNATEVQYPHDPKFTLVPGKNYRVIISTGIHSSTEDHTPNLGFSLLVPEEAKKVRATEARIRDLHLSDLSTRLLVAELYANWVIPAGPNGKALNAEAIEMLLGVPDTKEPAVARLLGDLYLTIGLTSRAEDSYLHALKLSQSAGDLEGEAQTQHALGRIFAKTKLNKNEAIQRLQNAKEIYQNLGDASSAAEVDRDIKETPQ